MGDTRGLDYSSHVALCMTILWERPFLGRRSIPDSGRKISTMEPGPRISQSIVSSESSDILGLYMGNSGKEDGNYYSIVGVPRAGLYFA